MRNGHYEMVKAPSQFPGKLYRGKYCYEHVLVWWLNTGTLPKKSEVIHHVDHNKLNNTFKNLHLTSRSEHVKEHSEDRPKSILVIACSNCRKVFMRSKRNCKNGLHFCSSKCIGSFGFNRKHKKTAAVSITDVSDTCAVQVKQKHKLDKRTRVKYLEWFPAIEIKHCACGKEIPNRQKYCSKACLRTGTNKYSLKDLQSKLSNVKLASKYGVSETAIRKARQKLQE